MIRTAKNRRGALAAGAVVLWVLLLLRVLYVFGPDTAASSIGYSSDAAIPVLMANDDRPASLHGLHYHGTDRWGSWAFVVPAWIHRVTGLRWSPWMVFALQATWVLLGAWLAAR